MVVIYSPPPLLNRKVFVFLHQLNEVRHQVAEDLRTTWVFIQYNLEHMAKRMKSQEAVAELKALLAETGDRLR